MRNVLPENALAVGRIGDECAFREMQSGHSRKHLSVIRDVRRVYDIVAGDASLNTPTLFAGRWRRRIIYPF